MNNIFLRLLTMATLLASLTLGDMWADLKLQQVIHHGANYPKLVRNLEIGKDHPIRKDPKFQDSMSIAHKYSYLPKRDSSKSSSNQRQKTLTQLKKRKLPDIKNKTTILNLAYMSYNAYLPIHDRDWIDIGEKYNYLEQFGWDQDGIRGYMFSNFDNSTIVLAIKGTSAGFISGDSPTSAKDKLNDNLLFSCCCARIDPTWYKVCDCYQSGSQCGLTCLEKTLEAEDNSVYYFAAQAILTRVMAQYPDAEIWLTGHSLGGGLAGLLGLTYDLPTVTFQAPGDLMASRRLQLPDISGINPEDVPIWHFGHNTDPIFMGGCQGALSACYLGGYAMESKCHTGNVCVYDTKTKRNWGMDILKHRIGVVIEEVLKLEDVPDCVPESVNCTDCSSWNYV